LWLFSKNVKKTQQISINQYLLFTKIIVEDKNFQIRKSIAIRF